MAFSVSDRELQRFFFKQGLTNGLFLWVSFRTFLLNPNWHKAFVNHNSEVVDQPLVLLSRWQGADKGLHNQPVFYWLLSLIGAALGCSSMAAALSYSGDAPVNLWVLLGIFALLPLFMTVAAAGSLLFSLGGRGGSGNVFVQQLIRRSGIGSSDQSFSRLISAWALWKLQSFSLLLVTFSLITFLVMATFQDFTFGWSSTLIENDQTMVKVVGIMTAPWQWLVASPTNELIIASRFYHGEIVGDVNMLSQWWPTLVTAIIFYGLLPRLLLQQVSYSSLAPEIFINSTSYCSPK